MDSEVDMSSDDRIDPKTLSALYEALYRAQPSPPLPPPPLAPLPSFLQSLVSPYRSGSNLGISPTTNAALCSISNLRGQRKVAGRDGDYPL